MGRQLEHGVGIKENQTNSKKKNAERFGQTESITTFRAKPKVIIKIQDMNVKSSSVSSWSYRSYVNPTKNHSQKKSCKRTLILKRVTHIHIFFPDCSTISKNSENDDIFIESTTRPRSTPQPLATKTTSNPLRTQLSKTQNKLVTEGKTDFDGNLTSNMTLVYCAVIVGNCTSKFPSLTCRR